MNIRPIIVLLLASCLIAATASAGLQSGTARSAPPIGNTRIGIRSVSAEFSDYGRYLMHMLDAIQARWSELAAKKKPKGPGIVSVRFALSDKGSVVEILDVQSEMAGSAKAACMNAITSCASFGNWTPDMKAKLGRRRELTLVFHYQ